MSGMKSIALTALAAGVVGVGVVAVVAYTAHPERPLLDAMLGFASGAREPGVEGPSSLTPSNAAHAGFVVRTASIPLDDGALLEACVVLGPRLPSRVAGAGDLRVLVADWDVRLGGGRLSASHQYELLDAQSREDVGSSAQFDLNEASRAAAALLGSDGSAFAGKRASPLYTTHVRPRSGLAWGDVTLDTDLEITVTQGP
jgi:hypothetical protein